MGELFEVLEEAVVFEDNPSKTVKVGSALKGDLRANLVNFLIEYQDVFAWIHPNMLGISSEIIIMILRKSTLLCPKIKLCQRISPVVRRKFTAASFSLVFV